jgi:hypothetical protein
VYPKIKDAREVFHLLKGLKVSAYPLLVPLSPVVQVTLHPDFILTVVFPKRYRIVNSSASFSPAYVKAKDNVLEIQPQKDFLAGNVVVYLEDAKGTKREVQLLCTLADGYSENGLNSTFFPEVEVTDAVIPSPSDVLYAYKNYTGSLPSSPVRFYYKGKTFILKPDQNGNVSFCGKTYLVFPIGGR